MIRILTLLAFVTVGLGTPPAQARQRRPVQKARKSVKKKKRIKRIKRKRKRARKPKRPQAERFAKGRGRIIVAAQKSIRLGAHLYMGGLGVGYFVADGLMFGVIGEHFFIDEGPTIYGISPEVRYTFWKASILKPYVGSYYRHLAVGRDKIQKAKTQAYLGARTGIAFSFQAVEGKAVLGFGFAYEKRLDCTETASQGCTEYVPELRVSLVL